MAIRTDERFPYYSRAFDCEVRSRAHLKELEAQHGVVPITEWDIDKASRKMRAENERIKKFAENQDREIAEAPHYARWRELVARGYVDQLKKNRKKR